jgi:hypothetical protein
MERGVWSLESGMVAATAVFGGLTRITRGRLELASSQRANWTVAATTADSGLLTPVS